MKWICLFFWLGSFSLSHAASLPDIDSIWNFGEPAETQSKFLALLPEAEKKGDLEYVLQLQTQIARTDSLQRKFAEAHARLDGVEAKLTSSTPIAEVRYLLERGRAFNSSGRQGDALPIFTRAYELGRKRKLDYFAIDAAHMMAIAEKIDKQLEWNLRAKKLAEKSADPKAQKWLAPLYNNIGWSYHESGKFKLALASFRKALTHYEKGKNPSTIRIAKWSVGRALRSVKKYEEALAIQLALEKEFEAAGDQDGYVFEELAELNLALENKAEAKRYFALAFDLLSKDPSFPQGETARLARLKAEAGK